MVYPTSVEFPAPEVLLRALTATDLNRCPIRGGVATTSGELMYTDALRLGRRGSRDLSLVFTEAFSDFLSPKLTRN